MKPSTERQRRKRERDSALGRKRREYIVTDREHAHLTTHLREVRGPGMTPAEAKFARQDKDKPTHWFIASTPGVLNSCRLVYVGPYHAE